MPDILHRVGIQTTPQKVLETLTTLEGNRAWWDSAATGDARKGGTLTFFGHDFKVTEAGPELVSWTCLTGNEDWKGTEVSFRPVEKDGQTYVIFKHAKWREPVEFMHHCSTKWAVFLLSLKDYLEKGKGHPSPHDIHIKVGG